MVRAVALLLALLTGLAPAVALAQPAPPAGEMPPAQTAAVFSPQELDQMLAPIALYPDALLAQVLTAVTYPLDVVAADRWVQLPANAQLRGAALAAALEQQPWDPSVKSLVPFPQVLRMMDARLDWMQRLGDAFLAQPDDVMASVQRLRAEARAAGQLASTPQQTVEVQDQNIVIVPANPQVVYVPYYDPTLVYGAWPYPAYPPIYLPPPPGFVVTGFFFGIGIAILTDYWGWCDFDWHRHYVHIDRVTYNRINYGRPPVTTDVWRHDPSRRGAVPYRDPATRARYQRPLPGPAPATRQQFRGYAPPTTAVRRAPTTARRTPTPPQAARPPIQPQAARPSTQPPAARPPARPQVSRPPAAPTATARRAPTTQQAARPPATAARPPTPQVSRPAPPQSVFQPSRGSDARSAAQRGQQSRQAPVAAAPRAAPTPTSRAVPTSRTAPAPSRGAAPAGRSGQPSGGQQGGPKR